jgi:hypothetical protein
MELEWHMPCGPAGIVIRATSLITLERLRGYTTLLAVCIWTIWIVDFSVPGPIDRLGKVKGTDFLHFYVTGSLAREGRWEQLYDARAQYERASIVAPGSPDTVFIPIESPQTALLVAPFAAYRYPAALAMWLAAILLLYAGCCLVLWRLCDALHVHRRIVITSCAAFPGLYSVVLHGQLSALALACVTVALVALRRGWPAVAGLALGLLVFKPHWAVAAGAVFLAAREWRVVAGIVFGAVGQLAVTSAVVGAQVMAAYAQALRTLPRIADLLEPRPGDSLRSLFKLIAPSVTVASILYGAFALATVLIVSTIWRSRASVEIRHAALILAIVLISPHVGSYDLVLLAPVYFLLANWLARTADVNHRVALVGLLSASFIAPICGGLPAIIRIQLSVSAMAALIILLWRIVNQSERAARLMPAPSHVRVLDQNFA